MNLRSALVLFVAGSALPACSEKATPAEKHPAKPTGTMVEATFEGTQYKFISARISPDNGVHPSGAVYGGDALVLSTAPPGGCDAAHTESDVELLVHIGHGPGGKRFAPGPLGVTFMIDGTPHFLAVGVKGVLNINAGEWKVGNKVTGTVRLADAQGHDDKKLTYTGSGSFEAEVCALNGPELEAQATPASADQGPATGTLGDVTLTFKSGLAFLEPNATREAEQIGEIRLFDAAVDCTNWRGANIRIEGSTGAVGKDVFIGSPQLRQIYFTSGDKETALLGPAWVKFDALELKEGTEIKGSVHGEARNANLKQNPKVAGRLSGTFTAKVCKEPCVVQLDILAAGAVEYDDGGSVRGETASSRGRADFSALKPLVGRCAASLWADDEIDYDALNLAMRTLVTLGIRDVRIESGWRNASPRRRPPPRPRSVPTIISTWRAGKVEVTGNFDPKQALENMPQIIATTTKVLIAGIVVGKPEDKGLALAVAKALAPNPKDPTIILQADARVEFVTIRHLIQGAKAAGYTNVLFAMKNTGGQRLD
ncbi:MAG: hypothetical protein H0T79_17565 [Deltaproteobacteria bacterium]|nr:hypothetical protein [Deltaproteobacteria bacterium]